MHAQQRCHAHTAQPTPHATTTPAGPSSAQLRALEEAAAFLLAQHDAGAAFADALQHLHRRLEVSDVEHRQLQLDVAKVTRAVGQRLRARCGGAGGGGREAGEEGRK